MRILYGVVGEGMGHATRSKVVCEHLAARGHQVKIVVSGRAHAFLAKSFPDVVEIRGLTIRYVDNRLDRDGTLARNVLAAPAMLAANVGAYFDKVARFKPDAVISDFDSFAYLFAKRHGVPVLSIDNQQVISRCKLGKFAKQGVKVDYQMTKAFVRAKLPACNHYVVTTFFSGSASSLNVRFSLVQNSTCESTLSTLTPRMAAFLASYSFWSRWKL